jgi:hypothetical protein
VAEILLPIGQVQPTTFGHRNDRAISRLEPDVDRLARERVAEVIPEVVKLL